MTEADERIGANLAELRGPVSQTALAEAMRSRGWKWSQPTVAAIEKGERAIKLAEAEDLLDVLGLDELEELTVKPLESIWWARTGTVAQARDRLIGAAAGFLNARAALAEISDRIIEAGQEVPDDSTEPDYWMRLSVNEVTDQAVPTPPLVPAPRQGPHVAALLSSDYSEYVNRAVERWGKKDSDGAASDSAE